MWFFGFVLILLVIAFIIALYDRDITEEEKDLIDNMHKKDLF